MYYKVDEALSLKNTEIAKELSLPPVKLHCSSNCWIIICNNKSLHKLKYLSSNL